MTTQCNCYMKLKRKHSGQEVDLLTNRQQWVLDRFSFMTSFNQISSSKVNKINTMGSNDTDNDDNCTNCSSTDAGQCLDDEQILITPLSE